VNEHDSQGREHTPAIELDGVSRTFTEGEARHRVLESVSMTVAPGEMVALRGRSGSGKSTLLNLVSGIDRPDRGRVAVNGTDLTALNERDRTLFRRRNIGFVYQAFNLVPTLPVAENIRLVLELNGWNAADSDARIAGLLDAVGLAHRADSYPDLLSGGEQQRVAIARALAHRPALILADEPTGNLDDRTAESVLVLLNDLVTGEGATLLMATHSNSVASRCDRVLEVRDAGLVAAEPR